MLKDLEGLEFRIFFYHKVQRFHKGHKVTFEVFSRVFAFITNADRPRRFGQLSVGSDTAGREPKNDSTVFNIQNP